MLGRHVLRRSHQGALHRAGACAHECCVCQFSYTKVNDSRANHAGIISNKHICRLQITVNHTTTVCMLDGITGISHHANPAMHTKRMFPGKVSNRKTRDEWHGEPRTTIGQFPGLKHCCNPGVIKRSNRLLFHTKACMRNGRSERISQDLHSNQTPNRMLLATKEYISKSTRTKSVQQYIPASTTVAVRHGVAQFNTHSAHRCIHTTGTCLKCRHHRHGSRALRGADVGMRRQPRSTLCCGNVKCGKKEVLDNHGARR